MLEGWWVWWLFGWRGFVRLVWWLFRWLGWLVSQRGVVAGEVGAGTDVDALAPVGLPGMGAIRVGVLDLGVARGLELVTGRAPAMGVRGVRGARGERGRVIELEP